MRPGESSPTSGRLLLSVAAALPLVSRRFPRARPLREFFRPVCLLAFDTLEESPPRSGCAFECFAGSHEVVGRRNGDRFRPDRYEA